jgi:hypothetical protein
MVTVMEPVLNGKAKSRVEVPAEKPKAKRVRKPKAAATPSPAAGWARFGVMFTLLLSAGLNGYANAQHAPTAWAGWLMGLAVPVLVLVLSKVAGEKWQMGQRPIAWFAGGSGVALLCLSVWHCANSIALLTGSGLVLSVPMAVAIDAGLVACELALIGEPRTEGQR